MHSIILQDGTDPFQSLYTEKLTNKVIEYNLISLQRKMQSGLTACISIDQSQETVNKHMSIFTDASFCRKMASKLDIVH